MSGNTGDSNPTNRNQGDVNNFLNTDVAAQFDPAAIAALKANGPTYGQGGQNLSAEPGARDNVDMNPILTAFNTWIAQQNASNSAHANYATLAASEQGRDATILSGPAVNPNTSIIGGR